jgi:hypothetical protein
VDDTGATLVFALIFITVVAVGVGAVLTLVDANLRSTTALRAQAAEAAAADGAANLAINALRRGTYVAGADCFGGGVPLTLSNFYTPQGGTTGSVAVDCEQDVPHSAATPITDTNTPDDALVTLATSGTGIDIDVKGEGGDNELYLDGTVFSNSGISVKKGDLYATSISARGNCTGKTSMHPSPSCNIIGGSNRDPGYAAPPAPTQNGTAPTACTGRNQNYTFEPGRFTDVSKLNAITNGCDGGVFWFKPGRYYFSFNGEWRITRGFLIGGGSTRPANPPTVPGACPAPLPPMSGGAWTPPGAGEGVQFIFGGESRMYIDGSARMELCGEYSPTTVPVAIFGLKGAISHPTFPVAGPGTCIVNGTCSILSTNKNGNFAFYLHGATYVPRATINLHLKKDLVTAFRAGIVAGTFLVDGVGSSNPITPMIDLPAVSTGPSRTVVLLDVYVCPTSPSCAVGGVPRLRAKVAITDPTGIPVPRAREITVLNWAMQR